MLYGRWRRTDPSEASSTAGDLANGEALQDIDRFAGRTVGVHRNRHLRDWTNGGARDWRDAEYEKGETQSFYNDFFEVFDVRRRSVARYEEHVAKLDNRSGFIDLFWPGVLIVEQKSAGRDLAKAYGQAGEYFDALPERDRPRYILVSDFQTFELHDLDDRETVSFSLAELPGHVEAFGFILGVQRRTFRDQDPVNIQAAELVGQLHDALDAAGYRGHDLERFLVRIVFCLFADDTGIFEPRDIFFDFLDGRTAKDGSDTGSWLEHLFQVLDTREEGRYATLDEDLARFPYVNGRLFEEPLRIPAFNAAMRKALLEVCRFDWSNISPAIFGALFQSVMDPAERRKQGAHYTTEKNILKVIEPLFLDDLRAEFERLRSRKDSRRRADLRRFQEKLGRMAPFDPACGCGNFLIIAYRELREMEIEVLKELHRKGDRRRNRRRSRTCGPTSAPASTCKAAAGGSSLCTMPRPMSWRGCQPYGIGSQRCVPTARPAGARRRGSWPRLRRCIMSTSSPPPPSSSSPRSLRKGASTYLSAGWSLR